MAGQGGGPGASTMTPAQAAAQAAQKAAKAKFQLNNQNSGGWFAIAILALMAFFTFLHWTDVALLRRSSKNGSSSSALVTVHRKIRSVFLRKIPGFTSVGHFAVFVLYTAVNIVLLFTNIDINTKNISVRLGWLASYNVCLVTFLAMKNTPLAFLTSYSYERLNILHQSSGYATVLWSTLHGIAYLVTWAQQNNLSEMGKTSNIMGGVAGLAMIIMAFSAILLRAVRYEIFYSLHIIMFMLCIIGMGMHRPITQTSVWVFACFSGGAWILDRLMRFVKVGLFNFLGNSAKITALPHGGVRITLARKPLLAVPGAHLFLWMPQVRAIETHPFTIVGTNPTELVVSAHDGFTKDLLAKAINQSGELKLRASVDGPYGTLPNFMDFDRVVLVAGGSGGSFTFGAVNNMLAQLSKGKTMPAIHFIWVVRETEHIQWFQAHLATLLQHSSITIAVHVTRQTASQTSLVSQSGEKQIMNISVADLEKTGMSSETSSQKDYIPEGLVLHFGRPDITVAVKDVVTATRGKTLVAACGPKSMMKEVRRTVADEVSGGHESLRLHCESFGW